MRITIHLDSFRDDRLFPAFKKAFMKQSKITMKIEDQEIKLCFSGNAENITELVGLNSQIRQKADYELVDTIPL